MSFPAAPGLPTAFRRLAYSNLAAQFSEQIALAAAPLIAVLLLGADAAQTGFLQSAQTLPFLLLCLPAGVLADRFSRRRLMAGAEALRTASLLGMLVLLVSDLLSLPLLASLGFLGAVGTVAYSVAAPALVPTLVQRDQLASANRWLELARSTAFAAGPAIGGVIVGWTGAPAAYVLATVLSLSAVVLLSGLPEAPRANPAPRHLLRELAEGVGFVTAHPLLRPILLTAVFFNIAWFVLQAVYVAYAIQTLGLSPAAIGMTLGLYGVGMVVGASAAPWLGRHLSIGAMIVIGPLCGLTAAITVAATIWCPSGLLAGLGFFLFGAGPILWTITTTTLRQTVSPNAMLGRISAVVMTATFGARPVGAALGALLAARFGAEACLVAAVVGFLMQFLVITTSPVAGLRQLPQAV